MLASGALAWMLVFGTVVPLGLAASDNNAPSFVEGSRTNRYAGEETAADGVFGAPIVATDSDEDAIRYTLGGGDASYFSIDSESGQLRTAATTTLEYETRNSYDVTVSASDGRGGIATIAVRIGVLDSVVTVPVQPSVRRRVRVTANESQIEEGKAVTFTFELLEQAPSGGVEIPFSLKQLAVDYGADTYDFRPLPRLNTHHHDSVSIAEGATTASVRYRTVADDYEETDAILVADIGLSSHDNFYGDSCNYEGSLEIMTISARPQGCWARVDVLDLGSLAPPEPVPFVRFASVFAGHVREFGGTNVQYIGPGDPIEFTISLNVPAPPGGMDVYYGLYEKSSDISSGILPYPNVDRRKVAIPAGETEVFLEIDTNQHDPIADDCEEEGHVGTACIRVTILSAPFIPVGDRHYLPYVHYPSPLRYYINTIIPRKVTITANKSPINEGDTAGFTITLSHPPPPDSPVTVALSLNQVGDFAKTLPLMRTVTHTTRMHAGVDQATLSLATVDDAVVEADGKIIARLQQTDAFMVCEPGEAEVVVLDNDSATVTIVALTSPIDEGETAAFEVRLSQAAPASGLAVQVALSQEGDFAASSLPELRTVQVGGGETTATVSVPTVNDTVVEDDGRIIALVRKADTYLVGEPGEAEVAVLDDDLATVTIVALASPIDEGETARFEVRLSPAAPTSGLAVQVALSQEGDFAASPLPELRAVQVGAGETTATVNVPTVDDAVTEDDGKILAAVQQAESYLVGELGEAEVVVRDDDLATVTIVALTSPIDEGETAAFEVRLSQAAPASGLAVQVALSQEGDFATSPLPELRAVQVGAGERAAAVSVPTVDDAVTEDDGRILAAVQQADTYLVGEPGEAEVVVRDDDLATVTIVALATPIVEGETAAFEVRLSQTAPASGLAVQVALSQEGDFAASPLPDLRAVQVGAGERAATVSVPTVDDAVTEDDGKIIARVQQADTYLVGEPGEAEVVVLDDDLATVTIVALATPIVEGKTAAFEVRLSRAASASGLAVQVALSQEGDFAASPLPELRAVQVGGGETTATVSVPTVDDAVVEDDGRILASVQQADTYLVGEPGEAEVAVLDDDLATVTIVALASPIYEGDTAQFEVRLSPPAPASGLAVQVALSQKGDFATSPLPELRTVQVGGGEAAVTLGVVTVNDTVVEDDGRIIALVRKADTYLVGEPGEAEVAVLDDDLATVTIVALASPIDEGETARFEVRLSPAAPSSGLAVEVALRQEGNFAASPLPKMGMVRVGAGEAAAMLDVATVDDEVVEDDGRIIAKVEQAATYLVGEPGEAEVAVLDDDLASGDDPTMEIIKEVVPRLGRTTAGIVAETIDCERYSRFRKDHVTIGGVDARLPSPGDHDSHATRYLEADAWHRDRLRDEFGMSTRQMLQSSSFELGSEDRDGGYGAAYWAEAAVAGFSGRVGSLSMTGSVLTGVGGMERLEDERRIGLAVARSRGDVTYNLPPVGSGEVRSSLTSVHPYLCWFWSDDSFAWGMVGAGWGEASLTGAVSVDSLKTSMRMFAGGGEWKLRSDEDHELVWKTSAFGVSTRTDEVGTLPTIQGNAVGFRSLIESAREHDLGSSALLRSSLQAGVRYDLGDAETGRGLLLGGGLRYVGPGEDRLLAEITGQTLARRTGSTFRDWSGTGLLRYSRGTGGRSLSLAFEAGRGLPGGAARRFLEAGVVPAESAGAPNSGGRAGLRLRYEMPVRYVRGNAAPSAGVTWRHDAPLLYSIGLNLSLKDGLELALGGAYQDAGQPESSVHLVLRVAW